jgi:transposase
MIQYREILRLSSMGLSHTSVCCSLGCSRNTVSSVVTRAKLKGIEWPLPLEVSDSDLQMLLFPEKQSINSRKIPDSEKLHKEMAKSGVTLTLLWEEYCVECQTNGEIPLGYTQFCHHYRQNVQITKATMHKPSEQMEVDLAGQTEAVIDSETDVAIPAYVFVAVLTCSGYA